MSVKGGQRLAAPPLTTRPAERRVTSVKTEGITTQTRWSKVKGVVSHFIYICVPSFSLVTDTTPIHLDHLDQGVTGGNRDTVTGRFGTSVVKGGFDRSPPTLDQGWFSW